MGLTKISGIFGVRDCRIAPITSDVSGAEVVFGSKLDVPGIKSLSTTLNVKNVENRGDEQVLDIEDIVDYIDVKWENAELSLDVLAAINGGDVTSTGTGASEVASYVFAGNTAQSNYFMVSGIAKRGSNDTKEVVMDLYKVKGTLTFGFVGEGFATCSFTGKGIRTKGTVNSKANALYKVSFYASSTDLTGVKQVETATVAGTVTTAGNATVTVTAAGMTGSPKAYTVAIALADTPAVTAFRIREALAADEVLTALFDIGGTGANVVLTKLVAAANDTTLNIAIANNTSVGLTPAATSVDTVAGKAPVA